VKSPHDFWMHIFWKFVSIRVLLSITSVYLHGYFEWKHKPKTLERILVRKYTFNLSAFFHNWLSCEFKRLTQVWKIELFRLFMHGNLISRILICLQWCSFLWSSVDVKWNTSEEVLKLLNFAKECKRISVWLWWVRIFALI